METNPPEYTLEQITAATRACIRGLNTATVRTGNHNGLNAWLRRIRRHNLQSQPGIRSAATCARARIARIEARQSRPRAIHFGTINTEATNG